MSTVDRTPTRKATETQIIELFNKINSLVFQLQLDRDHKIQMQEVRVTENTRQISHLIQEILRSTADTRSRTNNASRSSRVR